MSTLYLSGGMTSADLAEDGTYPAFVSAAASLRAAGHRVINPAENFGGDTGGEWSTYMRFDVHSLLNVEAVVGLPGWADPRFIGVRVEMILAATLDLPIREYLGEGHLSPDLWPDLTPRERAARLIAGRALPCSASGIRVAE